MYSLESRQLFDGGGDAALEQNGLAHLAQLTQQVEVLHVARAHLEAVDEWHHGFDLRNLHDFADHGEAVGGCSFAHHLKAGNAEALEAVGRAARLERAAAQKFSAGTLDAPRR